MADSYVCSGAIMKCSMGTSQAKLTVLPSRTVFLTGQPMANISDHFSMVNLAPFGRCRSLGFPATASATAANHGSLTPMPCMHNTPFPWMGGKNDYIIKGQPALLKSSVCQCIWGGSISIVDDGQTDTGLPDVSKDSHEVFYCEIPHVEFKYKREGKDKIVVLYDKGERAEPAKVQIKKSKQQRGQSVSSITKVNDGISLSKDLEKAIDNSSIPPKNRPSPNNQNSPSTPEGTETIQNNGLLLKGSVEYCKDEEVFYFITNHHGKDVEINNTRNNNLCNCKEHEEFTIDYTDKETGEIKSLKKNVNDGKGIKLYYYNIFHRVINYAKGGAIGTGGAGVAIGGAAGVAIGGPSGIILGGPVGMTGASIGTIGGAALGSVVDFLMAFRFIKLPQIPPNDNNYYYYTSLVYKTCAHGNNIPSIVILSYPDISFSAKIGMDMNSTTSSYVGTESLKTQNKSFCAELSIKYADTIKKLSFEHDIKTGDSDRETAEGAELYDTLKRISDLLKGLHDTAATLKEATGFKKVDLSATKADIQKSVKSSIIKKKGIDFQCTLAPKLHLDWKYVVSEDLRKLGKEWIFGISISGEIKWTFDIVLLAIQGLKRTAVVATDGLALLIIEVLEILIRLVRWLAEKNNSKKNNFDFYCYLIITGSAEGTFEGSHNTLSKNFFDFKDFLINVGPEFELIIGAEIKTTLFMVVNLGANAKAGCMIGANYKFGLIEETGILFFQHSAVIDPFKVYVKYGWFASFSWRKKKHYRKDNRESSDKIKYNDSSGKEWTFGGWNWGPWRYPLTR